jgi:hypothetical protein
LTCIDAQDNLLGTIKGRALSHKYGMGLEYIIFENFFLSTARAGVYADQYVFARQVLDFTMLPSYIILPFLRDKYFYTSKNYSIYFLTLYNSSERAL